MSSASYTRISVRPLTRAIGAECTNVDLNTMDDQTFNEIQQAFLSHQVLFFYDQQLTIEQQRIFTERFGPLCVLPYVDPMQGYPDENRVEI